jgi:protein ImuB
VLIAERRFAEPISREEDITATLASLATTLAPNLETQGLGARRLELALFRVDGMVARITVSAAKPIRAPRLVADLFREKFAGLSEETTPASASTWRAVGARGRAESARRRSTGKPC